MIKILKDEWKDLKNRSTLAFDRFFKPVDFIFENTLNTFDNEYYLQIFGTPMGWHISSVVAKILLDRLSDYLLHDVFNDLST